MKKLTPNASYSISLRYTCSAPDGRLGDLAQLVRDLDGAVAGFEPLDNRIENPAFRLIVNAASEKQAKIIEEAVGKMEDILLVEAKDRTFAVHEGGKLQVLSRYPLRNQADLSMAYTPGVARVCRAIAEKPELARDYTIKRNTVAIVTDGSAVLGLGNIGSLAGLPVMEGKAVLFREFAGVDAFPICLDTNDSDEIVATVKRLAPVFGGINLEDISAPRCFEIEKRLSESMDIPVFHDDQHGTAIVTLAALYNALRLDGRKLAECRIVINGAGAAGITIGRLLRVAGAASIIMCDSRGIISNNREGLSEAKQEFATDTPGALADAVKEADVFIGVSVPNVLSREMVQGMAEKPLLFAMSNPVPEVQPEEVADIAGVIATGRSDYPNQINNVLAFPGIFRGALDCGASAITRPMHLAAARAIAELIAPEELSPEYIIPSVFDKRVARAVAAAVAVEAKQDLVK